MGYAPKVKQYKYKNIAAALAACLLVVLSISTSCSSSAKNKKNTVTTTSSSAAEKKTDKNESSSSQFVSEKLTKNYKYQSIKNSAELGNGTLVVVNNEHPFTGIVEDTDGVYSYLFDNKDNQIMYASNTSITANKEAFIQFNKLACDFYKETKLATLMIVGGLNTTDDISADTETSSDGAANTSTDSNKSDNATGLALNLQLYNSTDNTYPDFKGDGKYSWIAENCWKYGYVLRYPADKADVTGNSGEVNHFRYVGEPFAEIMNKNNLALEELSDYVKKYTFENPLSFQSDNSKCYVLYYVAMSKETTTKIPVPLDDSNNEYSYTMSGNNIDGYIVCVDMTDGSAVNTTDSVATDDASAAGQ